MPMFNVPAKAADNRAQCRWTGRCDPWIVTPMVPCERAVAAVLEKTCTF